MRNLRRTLVITSLIILLPMVIGLCLYGRLPEQVATHFGFSGEADGFSSRPFAVFGIPLVLLALHLSCAAACNAQFLKKYPIADDAESIGMPRALSSKVAALILWTVPCVSLFIAALVYGYALGIILNLPRVGFLFLAVLLTVFGNYLPKCRQNTFVGIRLPWTLRSEANWYHTHRMAGPLWVLAGLACAVLGITGLGSVTVFGGILFLIVCVPTVYSFLYARTHD